MDLGLGLDGCDLRESYGDATDLAWMIGGTLPGIVR